VYGLKHQQEKRSMDYFAGLDVSVKETSVCIVDDMGKIVRELKVASEPKSLLAALKNPPIASSTIKVARPSTFPASRTAHWARQRRHETVGMGSRCARFRHVIQFSRL
jgi:hypothetical protein